MGATGTAALEIYVFGTLRVVAGGTPLDGFESDQVRALLAFLAVESDRPHRRESLATLLWPDEPAEVALHRLRQALANLRIVLGDRDANLPALRITRSDVQMNPARAVWSDTVDFERLLATCRAHPHRRLEICRSCLRRYEEAANLVRGPFLDGLSLAHSAAFADWQAARAEQLHQQASAVLDALAAHHERRSAHGTAVNWARRALTLEGWRETAHRTVMRGLAASGDRAGAMRQYRTCTRVLAEELGIEPDASTRTLAAAIESGEFPPARSGERSSLPRLPTRFIGRVEEMSRLLDLLARERLVTLSGPGGCGKTRLALALAEELAPDLPDRIWLVELDRVGDPDRVAPAVASALGLEARAPGDPIERVARRVGGEPALLLVDNCEHLLGACSGLISRLLRGCPGLMILATSREPLRVNGEVVWPVPPLGLPSDDQVDAAMATEAVELFVDRVQRVRPTFALASDNAATVAAICRRLEGMPLAIELAASWARMLAPERLLHSLDDQLALVAVAADGSTRHRSLRAVVDWSFRLLTEAERVLFRRLSIFVGGWTLEMAEAVCSDSDLLPTADVHLALAGLYDKSLIVAVDLPDGGRYRFLETVRQRAAEKLLEAGEVPALRARHAEHIVDLVEDAAPRLRGPNQSAWYGRLEREQANLRAAFDTLAAEQDAAGTLRLVGALAWFWHTRGHWRDGCFLLRRALALPGAETGPARSTALCGAALLAGDLGRHDEATALATEALADFRDRGIGSGEADALNVLGLAAAGRGDDAEAEALFDGALRVSQTLGDRWAVGRAAMNLGECALRRGALATARARLAQAAEQYRALGLPVALGVTIGGLARVAQAEGAIDEASRLYRESLAIHRRFGVRYGVIACLRGLAAVEAGAGATSEAIGLLEDALRIARDLEQFEAAAEIASELGRLEKGRPPSLEPRLTGLLDATAAGG